MAVAPPPVPPSLRSAQEWVRVVAHQTRGPKRVGWTVAGVLLAAAVGLAIVLISRSNLDETTLRLLTAPIDEELGTAEEAAAVRAARSEPAIPWEQARRELTGS